jgi:hypothetical protein
MKTLNLKTTTMAILLAIVSFSAIAQGGYGEIRGIIKDKDLEPVPFATVKILQGNLLVGGTQSDAEGRYKYKPLTPGTYEMLIMEIGHQTQPVNKIVVTPNQATYVDVKLTANTLFTVEVFAKAIDYSKSGVDINMYSVKNISAEELMQNAGYVRGDIQGALATLSSDVVESSGGEVHIRGSRGDASASFIDGVRTLGNVHVPGLAIENLTFFSGGVPAMYGDLSSGAVIVTTKSYFSGIRDKNIRVQAFKEKEALKNADEKAKLDEGNRKKEIEEEKLKDKQQ